VLLDEVEVVFQESFLVTMQHQVNLIHYNDYWNTKVNLQAAFWQI
jgi:hypothetical protein